MLLHHHTETSGFDVKNVPFQDYGSGINSLALCSFYVHIGRRDVPGSRTGFFRFFGKTYILGIDVNEKIVDHTFYLYLCIRSGVLAGIRS